MKTPEKSLRLVPLGGLGEIGMNCLALEQDGEIVVIDCGVTFPSQDLGIDVYHPRFDYLEARKDQVRAVVITHGHEDHVGALPYLLERIDVPVFAPPHALALARLRLREHGWKDEELRLHPITPRSPFEAGPFLFEPIRVTHSIADALALAIDTAAGVVIHTGDFKLDPGPQDGELTDEARFVELGQRGVRLLLSDSTNVDSPGHTQSEEEVAAALGELIAAAPNRVFVGMFASNVQRLLALGRIAERTGRRICLLGRSVVNHTQIAREVSRLPWKSDLVVPPELAATMPRDRLIVLASGTQAERNAALRRLASGTHPVLRIDEGDTVIFSSRVIPGNDRAVSELVDDLLRLGVHLVLRATNRGIHASGHAHRDEQARMIAMTRPECFIPVHGTLHHLFEHAALARGAGVADVLVMENGDVIELDASGPLRRRGREPVGRVAAYRGEELDGDVVRDRVELARAGSVSVGVVLDAEGELAAPPKLTTRGVLAADDGEPLHDAVRAVTRALASLDAQGRLRDEVVTQTATRAARRAIENHTRSRAVVSVVVTRLEPRRRSP